MIINRATLIGWGVIMAAASFIACQSAEPPASEPASESVEPPPPAAELSPGERLDEIKLNLETVKSELNEQGEYNCCVQPACHWCALHEGSCECFNNIQAGEAVCAGCGLGWHNGQGAVDGIDASSVEWNITHEHPTGGHAH